MTDKQTDSNKATSPAEWAKAKGGQYTITLPSGNRATIRPLLMDAMIRAGKIPNVLLPWAAKMLWAGAQTDKIGEEVETAKGFLDLVDWIVTVAMVDPVVVDSPKADNEISLDMMHFRDKFKVFDLSTEPAEWLKSFRDEQDKRLGSVRSNQDREPTE